MQTQVEFLVQEEVDPFSVLEPLPHEVTFFIPSTVDVNEKDAELSQYVLDYTNSFLSSAYGGSTEWASANGCWQSEEFGLVKERVTPVTCYVKELTREVKENLLTLGRFILTTMSQEAVLIVIDGKGHLLYA